MDIPRRANVINALAAFHCVTSHRCSHEILELDSDMFAAENWRGDKARIAVDGREVPVNVSQRARVDVRCASQRCGLDPCILALCTRDYFSHPHRINISRANTPPQSCPCCRRRCIMRSLAFYRVYNRPTTPSAPKRKSS